MFGYTDEQLATARRPAVHRGVVAAEFAVLVVGVAILGLLWAFSTRTGMNLVVRRLVGDAPIVLTVDDVAIAPTSRVLVPSTWRVAIEGIDVVPLDPERPTVHVTRLLVSMPELVAAWATRHLRFDRVDVVGLDVHVARQQASKPWTPRKTAFSMIAAKTIEIWDASVAVDPDGPLGAIAIDQIRGTLTDVNYAPETRAIEGSGALSCRSFRDGTALLRHVDVPHVEATGFGLTFAGGTFRYADGRGTISGSMTGFDDHPAIRLEVGMSDADVADLIETATGKPSPLAGAFVARFTVHAGGQLARGQAWMDGTVALDGGRLALGPDTREVVVELIRAAPFVDLDATNHVLLGDMTGKMRLERGRVEIADLRYQAPRRELQLRGIVGEEAWVLLVRVMPDREPDLRPGVGFVISGVPKGKDLRFRMAKPEELLGIAPLAEPTAPAPREHPVRDAVIGPDPADDPAAPTRPHPVRDALDKRRRRNSGDADTDLR